MNNNRPNDINMETPPPIGKQPDRIENEEPDYVNVFHNNSAEIDSRYVDIDDDNSPEIHDNYMGLFNAEESRRLPSVYATLATINDEQNSRTVKCCF